MHPVTLSFGELEPPMWGIAWRPNGDSTASLAAQVGGASGVLTGELIEDEDGETWTLEGDEASLAWEPLGPRLGSSLDAGAVETSDRLCRVNGQVVLEGREMPVRCLGWRMSLTPPVELERIESFRFVAMWFEPDDGLSLIALRPRKARGQEADMVAASVVDSGRVPRVADPRLSTTYAADRIPARAGLEMWLEEDENPRDAEAAAGYPRRAAGEAIQRAIDWMAGGFRLRGQLLRWHSHGREGPGVYLLGERE